MWFISLLINACNSLSGSFYAAYQEVSGWVWPFYYLANPLYYLSSAAADLGWAFYYFGDWAYDVASWISRILSWDNIWSLIKQFAQPLIDVFKAATSWWNDIWSEINSWWSAVQYSVREWIDAAVGGLRDIAGAWSNFWNYLWPQLTNSFNSLKSSWDNFWYQTLPNLVSQIDLGSWWTGRLRDVQGLINTAIKDAGSLAEGWQDMKGNVITFFQDPVEFIWQRFADWFLGPEV